MSVSHENNNLQTPKRVRVNKEPEHEFLISIANDVFGLNSWSHSVVNQDIDYIDCDKNGFTVGAAAIIRVEMKSGIHHQEIGYGIAVDQYSKGLCIAKARQEAVLSGLKKALCSFGSDLARRINQSYMPVKVQIDNTNTLNFTELHSPTEAVSRPQIDTSPVTDEDLKLERKRRQQQKREEFLQQLKQKQFSSVPSASNIKNNCNSSNIENKCPVKGKECMENVNFDDEPLISTQDLDRMVKSVTTQPKSRTPLFSSPSTVAGTDHPSSMGPFSEYHSRYRSESSKGFFK